MQSGLPAGLALPEYLAWRDKSPGQVVAGGIQAFAFGLARRKSLHRQALVGLPVRCHG